MTSASPPGHAHSFESDTYDDDGDENARLLKGSRKKHKKKPERTPLLHHDKQSTSHGSPTIRVVRPGEESTAANLPTETDLDDDDTIRLCHEQYGSIGGPDFADTVVEAIRAINHGIFPERIPQGSSGSYFVKNMRGERIAVFKPKNEEPYGHLNPKWLKWIHRIFFPCCFGRSGLAPMQGYLSEAGASLIDQKLGLNIVPKTAVVELAAPTFNYSRLDRAKARGKERVRQRFPDLARRFRRLGLPPKKGSFQLFVNGYKDAIYWLRQWELYPEQALPPKTEEDFLRQFQRMVILDYVIRNTDRGNDNWLIKYEPAEAQQELAPPGEDTPQPPVADVQQPQTTQLEAPPGMTKCKSDPGFVAEGQLIDIGPPTATAESVRNLASVQVVDEVNGGQEQPPLAVATAKPVAHVLPVPHPEPLRAEDANWEDVAMPKVYVAAIDNGLAFPFKHPDEWRTYPYRWASLPVAKKPFTEDTVEKFLPLFDNTDFVRELGNDLKKIFMQDSGFDKKLFEKQLSVMRGQIFNLREALRTRKTPEQLVQMTPQYMIEVKQKKRRRRGDIREQARQLRTAAPRLESTAESLSGYESAAQGTSLADGATSPSEIPQTPTNDELTDPKSWHNTFQQKVQTRSAFFTMW
ncbi:Protein ZC8.6 [Aphelenchoides avenae]|nr:Protein ZC8.6 [Aphelenchus avenae]